MEKREQKLNHYINSISINTTSSNISVYSDTIKEPIVRYTGEFSIREKTRNMKMKTSEVFISEENGTHISGRNSQVVVQGNGNGVSINIGSNTSIINCNGLTIVNGKIISNGTKIIQGEKSSLELIIPKNMQKLSFDMDSKSGSVKIEDLLLERLYVKTLSGKITLNDIDALFARLETLSGNIDASIVESILNYKAYINSLSGRTVQESVERITPEILQTKHELEANTLSGNIKLVFKGKR